MNGHLDANLAALRKHFPAFWTWWEKCPPEPGEYNLLSSLSGLPDLEIVRPGGQRIILYNRENPFEAVREEMANQTFPKGNLTFLFGLGLGYRALHILDVMEAGHAVYIVERDPDILRLALALHDYSAEIRRGNIVFAVPEEEDLRRLVQAKSGALMTGRPRLFLEEYTRHFDPRNIQLHDSCVRMANAMQVNFNTVVQLSGTLVQNELENLPKAILGWNPEGLCSGAFRNRPAIIVATGPSLQKNITLLRRAQGKALIIAVAQALRVLLAYDIRPDIICSIDFGEPNYRELADAIQEADMPLLMHPQVYPKIPKEYQGDLFIILDRHNLLVPPGGKVPAPLGNALTVAHTALNLALAAGADPIIFTGQDLAFGESSHISGALASRTVSVRENRVILEHEQGNHEQAACRVPGYFGGRVLTNVSLFAFLEDIEATVRRHPGRRFINATEGGARIAGTDPMSLRDALESHCRNEFPVSELLAASRTPLETGVSQLCRELEAARTHLGRILRNAGRLDAMIAEMKTLLPEDGGKGPRQETHPLNSMNRKAIKTVNSLLDSLEENRVIRLATARVKHLLIQAEEHQEKDNETGDIAGRAVRYGERLCSGLRETCPPLLETLDRIQSDLDEYASLSREIEAAPSGEKSAELRLRLGKCLRRMGHLEMAAGELERAAGSAAIRTAALEDLFSLHLDRNRFEPAWECLRRLPEGHARREEFQVLIQDKRLRDRDRHLEEARRCLDRDDFAGCLLACRRLAAHRDALSDMEALREQAVQLRNRKIQLTEQQVIQERERHHAIEARERRLQNALRRMEEKDYAAALALFRELAGENPDDAEAGLGIVRACEGLKNWEAAGEEMRRLTDRHPEKGKFFLGLGNILLQQGKGSEAIEHYQKAVDLEPSAKGIPLQIASILSSVGRSADALPFFERHLKENPNDYRALVLWGDGFLRLGIGAAARISYETALRIRPGYGPAEERLMRLQSAATAR
ncbi:MAG: 6-hydroxymethylpterin diphosphokinase MptE-like protein [Syntrophales bacterium]